MEQPENPIPDFQKELVELADAQDVKAETQKSRFAELACAQQKLDKEAEDVLRVAYENSSDSEKFILDAIEEYAKDEGISVLAAKARVLQYLSVEWKEKVDAEVREYFEKFDVFEFVRFPASSEESNEAIEALKILCDEGYTSYFAIAVHYQDDPEAKKLTLVKFEKFVKSMGRVVRRTESLAFTEKEAFVMNGQNIFPEARKYLEEMKKSKTIEEYEYIVSLVYKYSIIAKKMKRKFKGFDCDEKTIFLQKLAMDENFEVGNYMNTSGHVVLKLDGTSLVLDTRDMKIRTIEECARQEGYGERFLGSCFWRDQEGQYMAQYKDGENYPKKIIGYKRVENPYVVGRYENVAALLTGRGLLLGFKDDFAGAQFYYEKALEIDPNNNVAHGNLALDLRFNGDVAGAQPHYEKALDINPNNAGVHNGLANVLRSNGDVAGAQFHYEKALEIDPNNTSAHNDFAGLLKSNGDVAGAQFHYEKALDINPKFTAAHKNLAGLLKSNGDVAGAQFHFEKALESDPDNIKTLGSFLKKVEDWIINNVE
jgi:Flp pilus assembly protein TadD